MTTKPLLSSAPTLGRRTFLRSAGAFLALPWLESFCPIARASSSGGSSPRRMLAIMTDLGMIPDYFFPKDAGQGYKDSPYTAVLANHREDFTVFSGLSHPEVNGGHQTDVSFLTGATHPRKPGFKNSVSLDQYAAGFLGSVTRYPTLTFRVGPSPKTLSYSADGVSIPSEYKPSAIYKKLFVQGSKEEVARQISRLQDGQSLMDQFGGRIRSLQRGVGSEDRERLDQYFTAFRDLEKRLHDSEEWEVRPKPKVNAKEPRDVNTPEALVERTRLIYDLAQLAVETDSSRLITIFVTQQFNPKVDLPGVELPHHALTHQISREETREQLAVVEKAQLRELDRLLTGLASTGGRDGSLLDKTMVLYGSNMGNASTHSNANLPVLLAGGGFKHGQHLAFDTKHNTPLCNLYVSMLQRLGIESESFSSGTGPLSGLDLV